MKIIYLIRKTVILMRKTMYLMRRAVFLIRRAGRLMRRRDRLVSRPQAGRAAAARVRLFPPRPAWAAPLPARAAFCGVARYSLILSAKDADNMT
jgi:hypothetical protein